MHNKNAKLGEQFDADAAAGEKGEMPHLFSGVSIHVNGFTIPSAEVRGWSVAQTILNIY